MRTCQCVFVIMETFHQQHELARKLKESTVMGAEMINDTTTDADAEMVAMLIQSLQSAV